MVMASTSFTVTSSSTPTPIATANSSSNANPPGTPGPTVLAFIAVGFLGCCVLALFIWRHVHRRIAPHEYMPGFARGASGFGMVMRNRKGIGEKPVFWDLKTDFAGGKESENDTWEGIMPVSVIIRREDVRTQAEVVDTTIGNASRVTPMAANPRSPWHGGLGIIHQVDSIHSDAEHSNKLRDGTELPSFESREIQITVTIAMPCKPAGGDESHGGGDPDGLGLVYALGAYERPWA